MQKRGLNAIITTVLIILIVIIAITLLWTILSPSISESSQEVGTTASCFSLVLEPKSCRYDADTGLVNVRVERRSGTSSIQGLNFIFSDNTRKSVNSSNTASLGELESKSFTFDYTELGGITPPPAWFTIAGIIDPKVRSCDEVRPPIACLEASCGDGIVDSFLGETCDEAECCDSSCHRIATCDGIDNNDNNLTDEEGEAFPADFSVYIDQPSDGAVYETTNTQYSGLSLNFYIINASMPEDSQIQFKSCWYTLDSDPTKRYPSACIDAGPNAAGITNNYTSTLPILTTGTHSITVYANDSFNRVSSSRTIFTISQVVLDLNSPGAYPYEIVRNNAVPINFSTTLINPTRCYYTLNNGQTNTTLSCQQGIVTTFSTSTGQHDFTLYINNTLFEIGKTAQFISTSCPGNADGNSIVNQADITYILSHWQDNPLGSPADLNLDGEINIEDIILVTRFFNNQCT